MTQNVDCKKQRRSARSSAKATDAETYVVDEGETSGTGEEEASAPVTPSETSDDGREDETHADDKGEIPAVLPLDDLVVGQVRDVGDSRLATGLEDHPSDVSPKETALSRVGVEIGVGVAVVSAVAARPPLDGSLDSSRSSESKEVLKRLAGSVGAVSPKTMVTGGDACGANGSASATTRSERAKDEKRGERRAQSRKDGRENTVEDGDG